MSLKIEDIKPGDILCYSGKWYYMIIRNENDLDCIWVAENCMNIQESAWQHFKKEYTPGLKLPAILDHSRKVTNLAAEILIEELKKIDNRT